MGHRSYQSLYGQNRRSPSCPEVGLWRPGQLGQRRPQGETNTHRLLSFYVQSLTIPFSLTLRLSEAHCLSALASVHLHNSTVQ